MHEAHCFLSYSVPCRKQLKSQLNAHKWQRIYYVSKVSWSVGKLPSVRELSLISSLLLFGIALTTEI